MKVASEHPKRVVGLLVIGAFARMANAEDHPEGWSDSAIATSKPDGAAVRRRRPRFPHWQENLASASSALASSDPVPAPAPR